MRRRRTRSSSAPRRGERRSWYSAADVTVQLRRVLSRLTIAAAACVAGCSSPAPAPTPTPTPDPPRITCPAPVSQVSPTGLAVTLVYGTPSVTNGASPVTTTCTPASGSVFAIGSTSVTCTATDARQRTDACTFTVQVIPPPTIKVTRFLAFGDSLTLGEDGNPPPACDAPTWTPGDWLTPSNLVTESYPTVLREQLAARYTAQAGALTVDSAGQGGETAVEGAVRFPSVLASRSPQVVLLMEGSNDIIDGDPTKIGPAINGLRSMIRSARGLNVLLATVPPMNPAGCRGRRGYATVSALNAAIVQLAQSEGVSLVDVNAAFAGNLSLIGPDGLHPTLAGFETIATAFFQTIRNSFETAAAAGVPVSAALVPTR